MRFYSDDSDKTVTAATRASKSSASGSGKTRTRASAPKASSSGAKGKSAGNKGSGKTSSGTTSGRASGSGKAAAGASGRTRSAGKAAAGSGKTGGKKTGSAAGTASAASRAETGTGKRSVRAKAVQDTDIIDQFNDVDFSESGAGSPAGGRGFSAGRSDSPALSYFKLGLVVIAAILMMLALIHPAGGLGSMVHTIMWGMFGTMSYLLPICILAAYVYLYRYPDDDQALFRVEEFTGIYILLCGFFQVCNRKMEITWNPAKYFQNSDHPICGGVIGGMISGPLQKLLGTAGAVVVILVLIMVLVILITRTSPVVLFTSLFASIREGFRSQLDGFTEEKYDAIRDRRREKADHQQQLQMQEDDPEAEAARRKAEEDWLAEEERRAREQERADRFRSSRRDIHDPGRITDLGGDWNDPAYDADAPSREDQPQPGRQIDPADYSDMGSRKKNGFIPAFLANGFPFTSGANRNKQDKEPDPQYDMTDLRLRDFPANGQGTGRGSRPSGVRNRVQTVDPSAWDKEFSPDPEVTSTDEYDLRGRYPDRQDSGSMSGGGRTSRVRAPRDRRPIDQIGVDNLLADDVPVYNASGIDDFIVYDGLSRRNGSSRPAYVSDPDLYDEADPYDEPAYDHSDEPYGNRGQDHMADPYGGRGQDRIADPYGNRGQDRMADPYGNRSRDQGQFSYREPEPVRDDDSASWQVPARQAEPAGQQDPYYDLDDDEDDGGTYDPYENVDYRRDIRSDGVSADGIIPDDYGMGQTSSSAKADRRTGGNSSRLGNGSQSIWRDPSDTASRGSSGSVTFRSSGSGNGQAAGTAAMSAGQGAGMSSAAMGAGQGGSMGTAAMGAGQGAGRAGQGSDGGRQDPARQGKAGPRPAQKKKKTRYKFPSTELLKRNNASYGGDIMSQREMQEELRRTLENFGVSVTMGDIAAGPTVTRFELIPDPGVKVSRITNLQDDIKLALASADVRIEAPIPGKRAVGIEVPNSASAIVGFRELVESREFRRSPSNLSVCVGRNLDGEIEIADLAKMPHLLIAGATGSGKSVCINTFIMSILYKADPEDVKLIMIDPKVVELSVYNGIPHLLIPVVTDARKAANALHWAVEEMDARYRKFAKWNARNLTGYNEALARKKKEDPSLEEEPMSQMVIIIDELADLMMVSPSEVEESICRLAQKARAAGIHMVLATQRPSVNVITGLIKANVPSRIAFAVSSGVDSRTIIDMNGAEKLLGKGDMLYYPYGFQKPIRVQGAFISDDEVSRVVDQIIEDNGEPSGEEMMEQLITSASDSSASRSVDRDEYFEEAGRFIIENDKATSGSLQRQFHIGFNRAARIMDQLAEAGVVGEEQGTKPRQIMMNMEQFEAMLKS